MSKDAFHEGKEILKSGPNSPLGPMGLHTSKGSTLLKTHTQRQFWDELSLQLICDPPYQSKGSLVLSLNQKAKSGWRGFLVSLICAYVAVHMNMYGRQLFSEWLIK